MKWDFTENGCLFLPHSLHCEMAMLLVKVCCRYEREKQDSGLFVKSIDHVQKFYSTIYRIPPKRYLFVVSVPPILNLFNNVLTDFRSLLLFWL